MSYAINLEGKRFGKLTVIKRNKAKTYHNGKYRAVWICKCDCGGTTSARSLSLRKGYTKSCGCLCLQRAKGSNNSHFKGCGDISGTFYAQLKERKKRANILLTLSIKDLWKLFLKQNKKCALTGRELKFCSYQNEKEGTTASLDRIDSNKGYIEGNVQWVHKDINMMKHIYSQDYFVKTCKEVANYKKCDTITFV